MSISLVIRLVVGSLMLLLLPGHAVHGAKAQQLGYGGLAEDSEGYQAVLPGEGVKLPDDYGAHPSFRLEWWYITANLTTEKGEQLGLQWTLFRNALRPRQKANCIENIWCSNQIWMGHAAVTSKSFHYSAERFARGGIGQAGLVHQEGHKAFIDDWSLHRGENGTLEVKASADDFAYTLHASPYGPEILQGDKGYSLKSPAGQASYYFSHPYLSVEGELVLDGQPMAVAGKAWLDREWSSQLLSPSQAGWDWFALRLEGLGELVAFRVRDNDAQTPPFLYARLLSDGEAKQVDDLIIQPEQTASTRAPREWRLVSKRFNFDINLKALNKNSVMKTVFPYFEGPVTLSGSHEGRGYLEMTGYQD